MNGEEVPVKLPDGSKEQFTVRIAGRLAGCPCGCNVFHKPDDRTLDLYQCNGCGSRFVAE